MYRVDPLGFLLSRSEKFERRQEGERENERRDKRHAKERAATDRRPGEKDEKKEKRLEWLKSFTFPLLLFFPFYRLTCVRDLLSIRRDS